MLKEIVDPKGARFELRAIPVGDPTLSALEVSTSCTRTCRCYTVRCKNMIERIYVSIIALFSSSLHLNLFLLSILSFLFRKCILHSPPSPFPPSLPPSLIYHPLFPPLSYLLFPSTCPLHVIYSPAADLGC